MRRSTRIAPFALDLHVLGTPPAFVLSQDQTLQLKIELFELAYLPFLSELVGQALTGVSSGLGSNGSRCSGHAAPTADRLAAGPGWNVRIQLN